MEDMVMRTENDISRLSENMYRAHVMRAEAVTEQMAGKFWPMIGTANQCAYNAIDEAIDAMRESGMLRQEAKRRAMMAVAEYDRYDRAVLAHFRAIDEKKYYLWADMVARAAEALEPDVMRLYFAIKNVIDSHKVGNSDVLAKIQTALALVTLSTLMYDTMERQFQGATLINISDIFRGGRLTAVESHWRTVGDVTGRMVMQDVDLRHDESCMLGVQVLLTRYQSAAFLNEAAGEAIRLNPESMRDVKM